MLFTYIPRKVGSYDAMLVDSVSAVHRQVLRQV